MGLVRKIEHDQWSDELFGTSDPRAYGDVNINVAQLVDVAGHSLGGHLAVAFTRLFPNLAEALTINGAGFTTGIIPGLGLNGHTNINNWGCSRLA